MIASLLKTRERNRDFSMWFSNAFECLVNFRLADMSDMSDLLTFSLMLNV